MNILPAIASVSLGNAYVHPLGIKLKQAAVHGFKLIEIVEDDILAQAKKTGGEITEEHQIEAAKIIKSICDKHGISPFVLQPFWFYDGLLDQEEHEAQIRKLHLWMKLAKILDIRLIQIPTNWRTEGVTGDIDIIVRDLREMSDIGLQQDPIISFAYEAPAWGTYIDTWEGTWDVVRRVNRSNFGLCLDTYHIAARVWGDPTKPGCEAATGLIDLQKSMDKMAEELDVKKIFYLQLSDAERLEQPLVKGHPYYHIRQPPRMSWSRNARLFPFETDENGCLPVDIVLDTVVKRLKYKGHISMEIFSRKLFETDAKIPQTFADRAIKSWNEMLKRL